MNMKILSRAAILGTICMGVMMAGSSEVYADINGNESRVIAVAGGTFYYDGDYYQATNESLNELSNKLDASDTDLDAGQADEAIEKIYANVGTGVSEGYLQKVGGSAPGSTTTPGTGTDPGQTDPAVPGTGTDPGAGRDPGTGMNPGTGTNPGKGGSTNPGKGGNTTPSAGAGKTETGTGKGKTGTGSDSGTGKNGSGSDTGKTGATGTGTNGTATGSTGTGTGAAGTGTGAAGTGAGTTGAGSTGAGSKAAAAVAAANIPVDPKREALLDKLTGMTAGQRQAVVSDYNDKYADMYLAPDEDKIMLQAKLATGEAAIQENGNTGVWNALSESEWYEGIRSDLLNKRPELENAKNKVVYDQAQNALVVTGEEGEERTLPLKEFFPYAKVSRLFTILAIAGLLVAAAGLGLSLYSAGRSLSIHKQHSIGNIAGMVGAAAAGLNLLILGLAAGCGMGVLSTNTIIQEINTSGFYQYAYETMNAKTQQILMVADYDRDTLSQELNFNRFQFLSKQQTMDILNGKETLTDPGSLQNDIKTALDNSGEHGGMVNTTVAEKIMEVYTDSLPGYEIIFIKEIRDHFKGTIIAVMIMAVLAIILAALTLYRDETHRKKVLKNAGIACGAAMAAALALFAALTAGGTDNGLYISPEYLYIFAAQVLLKLKNLCLMVAALCAATCIGLTVFSVKIKPGKA